MTGYQIIHQYEEREMNPLFLEGVFVDNEIYITTTREQVVATFANEDDAVAYVAKNSNWQAYGLGLTNVFGVEGNVTILDCEYVLLHCGKLIVRPIIGEKLVFDNFNLDEKYNFAIPYNYEVKMWQEFFYGDWDDETEEDIAEKETDAYKTAQALIDTLLPA